MHRDVSQSFVNRSAPRGSSSRTQRKRGSHGVGAGRARLPPPLMDGICELDVARCDSGKLGPHIVDGWYGCGRKSPELGDQTTLI